MTKVSLQLLPGTQQVHQQEGGVEGGWEAAAEISTNVIGHGAEPVRESIPGF